MASAGRIIPFTRTSSRKLDFRIVTNVINVLTLALLGAAGSITIGSENYYIFDLVGITGPAISILWTTVAIILLLRSSLKPRYHPAIDLTFDLISWLANWIFGAWLIAQVAATEGLSMCSPLYGGSSNDRFCRYGLGERKWNINTATCPFLLIIGIIHLVFFSIACQEVKMWRRNQWGRKRESYELDRT